MANLIFLDDFKKTNKLLLFLHAALQFVLGLKGKQFITKEDLLLIIVFVLLFFKKA